MVSVRGRNYVDLMNVSHRRSPGNCGSLAHQFAGTGVVSYDNEVSQ
jgi:hypothetical protein